MASETKNSSSNENDKKPDCIPPVALNVIFHGLFAFITWDNAVEVLVPRVTGHVYKAGGILAPDSAEEACKDLQDLSKGETYNLAGVIADTCKTFDCTRNAALTGIRLIDRNPSKVVCSLLLPHPDQIRSIKVAQAEKNGLKFFSGKHAGLIQATQLALLQVFIYENLDPDSSNVGLRSPTQFIPGYQPGETINLHVFAEPIMEMNESKSQAHVLGAVDTLFSLFPGLDIHLKYTNDPKTIPDPDLFGLSPYDKLSLGDLCGKISILGINVHNCMSASVNNMGLS